METTSFLIKEITLRTNWGVEWRDGEENKREKEKKMMSVVREHGATRFQLLGDRPTCKTMNQLESPAADPSVLTPGALESRSKISESKAPPPSPYMATSRCTPHVPPPPPPSPPPPLGYFQRRNQQQKVLKKEKKKAKRKQ
ncbi:hypothetical protein M0804_011271 [Polistes exclamans]|nr:hypothetical protein M0804_011271 [Polistes exclamans]